LQKSEARSSVYRMIVMLREAKNLRRTHFTPGDRMNTDN